LLLAVDRLLLPRYANCNAPVMEEISEPQDAPMVVAGFGRYGQIVGAHAVWRKASLAPCWTMTPR
jgi:glutathione-regulated potassium-efflux system ancillary protein KefC